MAIVLNLQGHSVALTGGYILGPGEQRNVDTDDDYTESLIADGLIAVIDADTPPPPDEEPLKDTIRKVFLSHAQPTFLPQGAIWHELDADFQFIRTWEMFNGTLRERADLGLLGGLDPNGAVIKATTPFVTSRLQLRDSLSIRDHSAGTPTGDADNSEAFGEVLNAAGTGGLPTNVVVPSHPDGSNYNVNAIIPLDRHKVKVDGPGAVVLQQLTGRMIFDVTGDDCEINDIEVGGAEALVPRPSWSYAERDATTNAKYNQDATSSRGAGIYAIGAQGFRSRGVRARDIYTCIRVRPLDRYTTDPEQALRGILIDTPDFERYCFGLNAMGIATGRLIGGQARDVVVVDTVPPHAIYFAGAGNIPEGIIVPGKAVTSTASTDLWHTGNPHGFTAGTIVEFEELTGGGAEIVEGTEYYVIASGLTDVDFKVSATLGGAAINLTVDVTIGTVTATPDLDDDGDSDLPPGKADWPLQAVEVAGWVCGGNPHSTDYKLRNMFGGSAHDLLSATSARAFEISWCQDVHFARLKGYDGQQVISQTTGLPTDSGTQSMFQMNFCSRNLVDDIFMQTDLGRYLSAITLRNGCSKNYLRRPFASMHVASDGGRAHLKLVDCADNQIDGLGILATGVPIVPIRGDNAERNHISIGSYDSEDPAADVIAQFDSDSVGNVVELDRSRLSMPVSRDTVIDNDGDPDDNLALFPLEGGSRVGQAGEYAPTVRPGLAPTVLTGQTIKASRYSPGYSYTATSLAFALTVLASADDPVVLGVLDESLHVLAKSAVTAGVLNGVANIAPSGTGAGAKALALLTPVDFLEGQDYYIVALCTAASTTAQIEFATLLNTAASTLFGTAAGDIEFWHKTGQADLPAVGAQVTGQVTQSSGPFMAVRE